MANQKTIGIFIFAFLEIILGIAGSVFLIKNLMGYIATLSMQTESTGIDGALTLVGVFIYSPSPIIMCAGMSILISLLLGKKVNNMMLTFLYFLFLVLVIFHIYTTQYSMIIWDIVIFFLLTIPIQWFLNHPNVKNIEINQY